MSAWLRRRREPVVVCLLLVLACLLQDPGRITSDTKLDLVVAPVNFLRQALHFWDARAAFGHVPNQAFGYLFPIGPFFALGSATGIPMWIVQRLWMGLLLIAAFWGVLRVAEALDIGSDRSRLVGSAVYALSPPMTALVTSASGGQIPMALVPWVLLPLITGTRAGSTRRAAARSGIGVVAMGAVNAVSTLAVLPLPALWLLTRRRGPRRASLMRWWSLSVALACLWWVVPLLLQGRYGLNFTSYTEKAATTTATTSAFEVVRGTAPWLNYLFVSGPWLRGGWMLATDVLAIVGTGGLVAAGVYGLARRDLAERMFLCLAFGFGVVVIAVAYSGNLGGALAAPMQHLLDGPLSAFRNLTKFEPVLRVPLALGLAHGLTRLKLPSMERMLVTALVVVLVAL